MFLFLAGVIETMISLNEYTGALGEPLMYIMGDLEDMKTPGQSPSRLKHKCAPRFTSVILSRMKKKKKAKATPAKERLDEEYTQVSVSAAALQEQSLSQKLASSVQQRYETSASSLQSPVKEELKVAGASSVDYR